LGIRLDPAANAAPAATEVAELQAAGSPVRVLRIRANEELAIAFQTARLLESV
jgi:acetate kinase